LGASPYPVLIEAPENCTTGQERRVLRGGGGERRGPVTKGILIVQMELSGSSGHAREA